MSINAMTNAAVARRPDFAPAGPPPKTHAEIAAASETPPTPTAAGAAPPAAAPAANGLDTALQTVTTFIPTEVLTLYVSAVAALGSSKTVDGQEVGRWIPFYTFLVATPFLVWVAFATKLKTSNRPIPAAPSKWPIWEMVAATLAFAAWAFALPNTPFVQYNWYSGGIAGFLVLIVSGGLGAVAPLMQRQLTT
jgi:hypothetical protein